MRFEAPKSVQEALFILDSELDSCVFVGATDIIPLIRSGKPKPKLLVDLKKIPQLIGVRLNNGNWTLGAATPVSF